MIEMMRVVRDGHAPGARYFIAHVEAAKSSSSAGRIGEADAASGCAVYLLDAHTGYAYP
jgi:hypothetical protein